MGEAGGSGAVVAGLVSFASDDCGLEGYCFGCNGGDELFVLDGVIKELSVGEFARVDLAEVLEFGEDFGRFHNSNLANNCSVYKQK